MAERAAVAALRSHDFSEATLLTNSRGLRQIRLGLRRMGLCALPTEANFLMVEAPDEPDVVVDAMISAGLQIPHVAWNGYIQLPIAKPPENRKMLQVLACLTKTGKGA